MIEQVRLGSRGLWASRVALGMMSFGDTSRREWVLDQQAAESIVKRALEAGITFFDTASLADNLRTESRRRLPGMSAALSVSSASKNS